MPARHTLFFFGRGWIRTTAGQTGRFTACCFRPLSHSPTKHLKYPTMSETVGGGSRSTPTQYTLFFSSGGRFEPPRDKPAGLQPAAFDHSATKHLKYPTMPETVGVDLDPPSPGALFFFWARVDSNHRGTNRQVYSLLLSTTQPLAHQIPKVPGHTRDCGGGSGSTPTRPHTRFFFWARVDSNHRGTNRQVYSLLLSTTQPLAR